MCAQLGVTGGGLVSHGDLQAVFARMSENGDASISGAGGSEPRASVKLPYPKFVASLVMVAVLLHDRRQHGRGNGSLPSDSQGVTDGHRSALAEEEAALGQLSDGESRSVALIEEMVAPYLAGLAAAGEDDGDDRGYSQPAMQEEGGLGVFGEGRVPPVRHAETVSEAMGTEGGNAPFELGAPPAGGGTELLRSSSLREAGARTH